MERNTVIGGLTSTRRVKDMLKIQSVKQDAVYSVLLQKS